MKIYVNAEKTPLARDPMIYGHFIEHFHRQIYGGVQIDVVLNRIGRYLREQFRGATVFYERSGCFLIMIEERQTAESGKR